MSVDILFKNKRKRLVVFIIAFVWVMVIPYLKNEMALKFLAGAGGYFLTAHLINFVARKFKDDLRIDT